MSVELDIIKLIVETMKSGGEIRALRSALKEADANYDGTVSFNEVAAAIKDVDVWKARAKRFELERSNPELSYFWEKKEVLASFRMSFQDCMESAGLTPLRILKYPAIIVDTYASTYDLSKINRYLSSQGLLPLNQNFITDYVRNYRADMRTNSSSR